MTWNPDRYLQFSDERLRPAVDLLARIPLAQPIQVVDLGCGAGNVTRLLASRWPGAQITGLDSSPEMLERARAALPEARTGDAQPRLRFDAEHLYAAWCWVRVAGRTPCEPERIVWTQRSEPFSIADPTDLLGARPASIQMPDIPKLLRDIPRIARARAKPFAGMASPPGSGVVTGADMADTRRDFGIGMICNFGIPILTICALILFKIIFTILIALPSFSWMLFLKFCLPFPKRGP